MRHDVFEFVMWTGIMLVPLFIAAGYAVGRRL